MSRPLVVDAAPDAEARAVFGAAAGLAGRYADLLRGDGVAHGHIGPREADRLWERHLNNCAVVTDLLPVGARVVDVGSGAGLPGLPMAIRRADLHVTLLEPMQRRVEFLGRCVDELGLQERVDVVRGRADEALTPIGRSLWVTARAVAPLDRLVRWCFPLLADDGVLLALKGERAPLEVDQHRAALRRTGMTVRAIEELPVGPDITRVIVVERSTRAIRSSGGGGRR